MKISILLASYKREELLNWGLLSLSKQQFQYPVEVIVLNDGIHDDTEKVCNAYKEKLNIKYIFTGKRNLGGEMKWRCPGFAYNIGIKQSTGDIIFLSCAEMFHLNETVNKLSSALISNPNRRVISHGLDDLKSHFLNKVKATSGNVTFTDYMMYGGYLNVHLPFFMGIMKNVLIDIGGYDEDFTGNSHDDTDIIHRLNMKGINQLQVPDAYVIHLYHPRSIQHYGFNVQSEFQTIFDYNKKLLEERRNMIVRNTGREWGINE